MTSIDWKNPEERKAYFRKKGKAYRQKNPRVTATFTQDDFRWIEESARHFGKSSLAAHVHDLSLAAAKEGKSGEPEYIIPPDDIHEMILLLRSMANNLNQTARHLNTRALELRRPDVADETESKTILLEIFFMIQKLEHELRTFFP